MSHPVKKPSVEYIILIAMLSSIVALGSDIMLPGLSLIGSELGAPSENSVHYNIILFFLGFAFGQLVVGPLSDSFGRKPIVYAGITLFILGCLLSIVTENWTVMLLSRALQGLGAAARIVAVAVVRDEYEGRPMARVMSVVFSVFILVPMIAPAIGQFLIYLGGWQLTFVFLAGFAATSAIWFGLRQPETLLPEKRRSIRLTDIMLGYREVFLHRSTFGYTLAAGLIFGAFSGYLGTAQLIFHNVLNVGDMFALYFAVAAASIGVSSLLNAWLVVRFGMFYLTLIALFVATINSALFCLILIGYGGIPPIALFMAWLMIVFFCMGIIFANLNALAMEPMGHMAGLAAAFIGAASTFISLPFASLVGNMFNGTVYPLVVAFALLGLATLLAIIWTEGGIRKKH